MLPFLSCPLSLRAQSAPARSYLPRPFRPHKRNSGGHFSINTISCEPSERRNGIDCTMTGFNGQKRWRVPRTIPGASSASTVTHPVPLHGPRLSAYRDFHLLSLFRFPFTLPMLGVNAPLVQRGTVDTVFGDWVMDFPFPFLYSCCR